MINLSACILLIVTGPSLADDPNYNNFSSITGLTLNGDSTTASTLDGAVLRVAPATTSQIGSVYWNTPEDLSGGFNAYFTFRIDGNDWANFQGADGFTFLAQQTGSDTALGAGGGDVGYTGISPSTAVAFDTFDNSFAAGHADLSSDYVGVYQDGDLGTLLGGTDLTSDPNVSLHNGHLTYAWVEYDSGTQDLKIYLSQDGLKPSGSPTLTTNVDLSTYTNAYIGFTASTGSGFANHDILNWQFNTSGPAYGDALGATDAIDVHAGGSDGDWSDTATWQESQIPTLLNNVILDDGLSIPYTVTVSDAQQAQSLQLIGSLSSGLEATLDINGAVAQLDVAAESQINAGNQLHVENGGVFNAPLGSYMTNQGSILAETGATVTLGANSLLDQTDQGSGPGTTTFNAAMLNLGDGTYLREGTVEIDNSSTLSALGTLNIQGATVNISASQFNATPDGGSTWSSVFVTGGSQDEGYLNILSSTAETGEINFNDGGHGEEDIGDWTIHGNLNVGYNNYTGDMLVHDNSSLSIDNDLEVGFYIGSTGTMEITDPGTGVDVGGYAWVGDGGTGSLTVHNSAVLNISGELHVGWGEGSDGTLNIGDSGNDTYAAVFTGQNDIGDTYIGEYGVGRVNINGGAYLETVGYAYVGAYDNGDNTGGQGYVLVDGVDNGTNPGNPHASEWYVDSDLTVGNESYTYGQLDIQNGGYVDPYYAYIGYYEDSTGVVNVDGVDADSGFQSQLDTFGDLVVGDGGYGSLTITNGGLVTTEGSNGYIGNTSTGSGYVTIDYTGNGYQSEWQVGGQLHVGNEGYGELNITSGGIVSTGNAGPGDLTIGDQATGSGYVYVDGDDGSGSTSELDVYGGPLIVGNVGYGELHVTGGGYANIPDGPMYIGGYTGSSGTVEVNNLTDTTPSVIDVGSFIEVGDFGYGELDIGANGEVTGHFLAAAFGSGATGHVNVSGSNTALTITPGGPNNDTGELIIGQGYLNSNYDQGTPGVDAPANGFLTVESGGVVSDTSALIGSEKLGVGAVTVDGAGSQWDNSDNLVIGGYGNGSLVVSNGGAVTSNNGYIARHEGATGGVTVTDSSSNWAVSGDLYLAGNETDGPNTTGTSTLYINNSGHVSVSNLVQVFVHGTIDMDNGSLQATTVDIAGHLQGTGSITGNVTNAGDVAPGHSPGAITIDGNYTQTSTGFLDIQIGGYTPSVDYDQLHVVGSANLAGNLQLELIDDFLPQYGDSFTIQDANSISGIFTTVSGELVNSNLALAVTYSATAVTVTAAVPGDANLDGLVNLSDLQILGDNWQSTTAGWTTSDFTGDGSVNLADLQIIGDHWGYGTNTDLAFDDALQLAGVQLPEPGSFALIAFGCLAWIRQRGHSYRDLPPSTRPGTRFRNLVVRDRRKAGQRWHEASATRQNRSPQAA